jgi:hypothetical protein
MGGLAHVFAQGGAGGTDPNGRDGSMTYKRRLGAAYYLYEEDSFLYGYYSLNNEQHVS